MSTSVTITAISRDRDSKKLIREYNWGFLRLNPQYRTDYRNLVESIYDVLNDSKWKVSVEKSEFVFPLKITSDIESLCKAFQRKWRISLPANPYTDLPTDVVFQKIKEAVVAVTTPDQLNNQQEILSTIQSMTQVSYKNKTREKDSWSDKPIYALLLVDLRWSNERDIVEAYRTASKTAFASTAISSVEFHFFGPGKSHLIGPPRFSV